MKSYVIHLIRNAPSVGNLQGRYIGRTDSPIADEGISRLLELKQKHGYPEASAFYASPSTRCVDTLKILYPQAEPEVILEMAECLMCRPCGSCCLPAFQTLHRFFAGHRIRFHRLGAQSDRHFQSI